MTTLFAVYGTLKRGYSNNRILSNSDFVCEDSIEGLGLKYSGFPVAYKDPTATVKCEIFETYGDKGTIERLDRLEGVPSMYERHVMTTKGGHEVNVYVGNPKNWNISGMKDCIIEDGNVHSWPINQT